MGEKSTLMAALVTALETALPTRIITREFHDFAQRKAADLTAGVITLIAHGTGDYGGNLGRFGTPGRLSLILVGQLKISEKNTTPKDVEDAEFALLEEVEAFCAAPAAPLGSLLLRSAKQSGQTEYPYGWIACELEFLL